MSSWVTCSLTTFGLTHYLRSSTHTLSWWSTAWITFLCHLTTRRSKFFFLCYDLWCSWGFHTSSDEKKSSGDGSSDGEATNPDWCAASLTSFFASLATNLNTSAMSFSSLTTILTIAWTAWPQIGSQMIADSNALQTPSSFWARSSSYYRLHVLMLSRWTACCSRCPPFL